MEWLILALFVVAVVAAVRLRRVINDPATPLGRWFESRGRPWLRDAAMAVFIATVLGWVIINVAAPEEGRKDLKQIFKEFWAPVGHGRTVPPAGVREEPKDKDAHKDGRR